MLPVQLNISSCICTQMEAAVATRLSRRAEMHLKNSAPFPRQDMLLWTAAKLDGVESKCK